jgi:hypothetical protein
MGERDRDDRDRDDRYRDRDHDGDSRRRMWGNMLSDAQELARRRPALLIGGAVAAGFLAARYLKRSAPARDWRDITGPAPTPGP